jgi:hypothetical protein
MDLQRFHFNNTFGDLRLDRTGNDLVCKMISGCSSVLNRVSGDLSQSIKYYRFINNSRVKMEQIKGSILNQIGGNVSDKEVVIIQDTTELNYEKFRSIYRTDDPDLGPTGNDNFIGFFLHCSLVIDAESSFPLGFSDIQIWNRHFDKVGKVERKYQFQRIEDKESNRWLTSVDNSARVSNSAALRWFVSDRESDIYDLLAKFPMERAHFVIRISQNRTIKDSESLLFDYIDQTTPAASYPIEIIEKKSAEKKTVNINVRFGTVEIKVPKSRQSKTEKKSIKLSFVEAYSKESQTPISWRLYTDVDVQTVEIGRAHV